MSATVTNLIQGPGTLYSAPFGAVEPADATVNTPPAATGVGSFADVGGTLGGVTLSIKRTYVELEVDQVIDIPGRRQTKREVTIITDLAEPTLANLMLASNNDSVSTTGASFSASEPVLGTASTQPIYSALLFDGFAPGGFVRRVIVRRGLQTGEMKVKYNKKDQTVLQVIFEAHYVSSLIKPFKIIDQTA